MSRLGLAPLRALVGRAARASLHGAWLVSMRAHRRDFEAALDDPDAAQRTILARRLRADAGTEYGRRHGFGEVSGVAAYQARVPIVGHDDLAPLIDRAAAGHEGVLTAEPVQLFERSSGSAAAAKLVAYTAGLKREFAAATDPWLASLHQRWPGLLGGRAYWSISPVTRARERTTGGHPIGIEDDAEYLGRIGRAVMGRLVAVPAGVARAPDMASWRRQTLQHLLAAEDLSFLSVWSPSFLTVLMEHLERDLDVLLASLEVGRRRRIERAVAREGLIGEALWPRLVVLSCWTDAASASFIGALRRWFPRVPLQSKGLLATEGVVSLPWLERGGRTLDDPALGPLVPSTRPAAVTSHFLELVDLDAPDEAPKLLGAVREGGRYAPLLTIAGGLWRYRLGDEVVCTGKVGRTPTLMFAGKLDAVSDLCGEKLSASHVARALAGAGARHDLRPELALLAPVRAWDPPAYCLYVDAPGASEPAMASYAAAVEVALRDNPHYAYARDLGQLGALRWAPVARGEEWYLSRKVAAGVRAGDVKPTALDPRWVEVPADARATSDRPSPGCARLGS